MTAYLNIGDKITFADTPWERCSRRQKLKRILCWLFRINGRARFGDPAPWEKTNPKQHTVTSIDHGAATITIRIKDLI